MSRTTFAEQFRKVVGRPPLDYLTEWHMRLAPDRLRRTNESVATAFASATSLSGVQYGVPPRHQAPTYTLPPRRLDKGCRFILILNSS
jgi:methylphosphotriester-DNA--protein-cysteine methyltransferase